MMGLLVMCIRQRYGGGDAVLLLGCWHGKVRLHSGHLYEGLGYNCITRNKTQGSKAYRYFGVYHGGDGVEVVRGSRWVFAVNTNTPGK